MKKILTFSAAVLSMMLVGCSKDSLGFEEPVGPVNPSAKENLTEIFLGIGEDEVAVYKTRGTGTVGSTDNDLENNVFNNENLFVLMTTKDAKDGDKNPLPWGYSKLVIGDDQSQLDDYLLFDNTFRSRAKYDYENSKWGIDYLPYTDYKKRYYPLDGEVSHFFAYYLDDAADNTVSGAVEGDLNCPEIKDVTAADEVVIFDDVPLDAKLIPFTINGSQDIIAGKASNGEVNPEGGNFGFSSKTARDEEKPNPIITLKHLLTRFTFAVVPGANTETDGIKVTSIKMKGNTKGSLIAAYNSDKTIPANKLIQWEESEGDLVLANISVPADEIKEDLAEKANLVGMDPVILDGKEDHDISGAIFAQPDQYKFDLIIGYEVPFQVGEDEEGPITEPVYTEREIPVKYTKNGEAGIFECGNSYRVKIIINGLKDIEIEVVLEPWIDGGEITVDPEDVDNPIYNAPEVKE